MRRIPRGRGVRLSPGHGRLRQSSDQHERVIAELLTTPAGGTNYLSLDEDARALPCYCALLATPVRWIVGARNTGEETGGELAIFRDVATPCATAARHRPIIISHRDRERPAGSAAVARSGPDATAPMERRADLIVVPLFRDHCRPAQCRAHHAGVLPGCPATAAWSPVGRRAGHHAGLPDSNKDGGIFTSNWGCTAPRSRWWTLLTSWPAHPPARSACSTAAAAPSAVAPATRPSWRSRRARCAARSG